MSRPFEPVEEVALAQQRGQSFVRLVELMQRLLAEDGCPWDREQTFQSLRKYVLEEACEVMDAIDGGDLDELRGELGDLLFQVVFQAEIGRAKQAFGPDDIIKGICDKLVRRHPHVFAEAQSGTSEQVLQSWEQIKAEERAARGDDGLLSGVPRSLPALARAQKISAKVARVGFDWPNVRGSREKVDEELAELDAALSEGRGDPIEEELGDALFALVNLARHVGVDAERALGRTSDKFVRRFEHVERRVVERHGGWPGGPGSAKLPLEELDAYWDEAKAKAKASDQGGG